MLHRVLAALLLGAVLSGCPATTNPSPSATIGFDTLAGFECFLPINGAATVHPARLTDVQVSSQTGFDRIAFSFDEGTPEFSLVQAAPPHLADPSGLPMEVDGERAVQLTFNGGTKVQDDGSLSYEGSTNIATEFPWLVHLVEAGDFEAVNTWFIGLSASTDPCFRVRLAADSNSVIIDVRQPIADY